MDQKHDHSRSGVTQYFLNHYRGLLNYGQYAVRLPLAIQKVSITLMSITRLGVAPTFYSLHDQAKMFENRGKTAKALQLCQQSSEQKFPLSDLLLVPIQRVLKYPLLMKVGFSCPI